MRLKKINFIHWFLIGITLVFYICLFIIGKVYDPFFSQKTLHEIIRFSAQESNLKVWGLWFFFFLAGSFYFSWLGIKYSRKKSITVLEKLEFISLQSGKTQLDAPLKLSSHSVPKFDFFISRLNEFIEWKDTEKKKWVDKIKVLKKEVDQKQRELEFKKNVL